MAFKSVSQSTQTNGEARKLTALKSGEAVIGYVVGFRDQKENPDFKNLIMRSQDGKDTFMVYTAGNVKYKINDGAIVAGLLTRITRLDDRKMKNGKMTSHYEIEQDDEQTIDTDAGFDAITSSTATEPKATSNAASVRNAVERASVKNQAASIAASLKTNR